MKEYVLVFAPPGVRLGPTVARLKKELDAETEDIDDEIKRDPKTITALKDIHATFTIVSIFCSGNAAPAISTSLRRETRAKYPHLFIFSRSIDELYR